MDSQEAYERRTFNEYSAKEEAAEARSDAIETIACEIADEIAKALFSGAEIQSRVYPGAKQNAVQELSDWAQEYDDAGGWIRQTLTGISADDLKANMIAGYSESFAEGEYDEQCERNAAEAAE